MVGKGSIPAAGVKNEIHGGRPSCPGRRVISYEVSIQAFKEIVDAIRLRATFLYRDGCANYREWMDEAGLVILDVDPHDGVQEAALVAALDEAGWAGIMLCDDIVLRDGMKDFWAKIPQARKWDVTEIGHSTGSGIIGFGGVRVQFVP